MVQTSHNDGANTVQFCGGETVIRCQHHWLKPILAHHPFAADMNMPGLIAVQAVEEKAIGARDTANGWHRALMIVVEFAVYAVRLYHSKVSRFSVSFVI
jgi:hypothetical protein